jgi:hypothetical protein
LKQLSVFLSNGNGGSTNHKDGGTNSNYNSPSSLPRGKSPSNRKTHDAKGNPIDRTGPTKVEPTVRDSKTMSGRREYWCETCGRREVMMSTTTMRGNSDRKNISQIKNGRLLHMVT